MALEGIAERLFDAATARMDRMEATVDEHAESIDTLKVNEATQNSALEALTKAVDRLTTAFLSVGSLGLLLAIVFKVLS